MSERCGRPRIVQSITGIIGDVVHAYVLESSERERQ